MSIMNQLFNRALLGSKCKTSLNLAISRVKLLQNKREIQLKLMRKEIGQFLQAGQEAIARIRVEHVIREQNTWAAYEVLEMFCEFILARVPILESQKECPLELREAVASVVFAAPRCSDLPELLHVRSLFSAKYGKEFILAATELRPDTSVNRSIIEKLSVYAPPPEVRLRVMKEIAQEYNVAWDSSKTEAEFSKKPEDLLNGPKPISMGTPPSPAPPVQDHSEKHSRASPSATFLISELEVPSPRSPKAASNTPATAPVPTLAKPSIKDHSVEPLHDIQKDRGMRSSDDVLERARAAITAAERASAAARAAAALVNANFGSFKLEGNS